MSDDKIQEREEQAYLNGSRFAWVSMLHECLRQLGYDDPEAVRARWASEREQAINALRSVCADFGDNDWDHRLHLADVISKHLHDHLGADR